MLTPACWTPGPARLLSHASVTCHHHCATCSACCFTSSKLQLDCACRRPHPVRLPSTALMVVPILQCRALSLLPSQPHARCSLPELVGGHVQPGCQVGVLEGAPEGHEGQLGTPVSGHSRVGGQEGQHHAGRLHRQQHGVKLVESIWGHDDVATFLSKASRVPAACQLSQGMLRHAAEHIDDRGQDQYEGGKASTPHKGSAEQVTLKRKARDHEGPRIEVAKGGSSMQAGPATCTLAPATSHACRVPESRQVGSQERQQHDGGSKQGTQRVAVLVALQRLLAASRIQTKH